MKTLATTLCAVLFLVMYSVECQEPVELAFNRQGEDLNNITLTCRDTFVFQPVLDSVFLMDDMPFNESIEGFQVVQSGVIQFTLSPETESVMTCETTGTDVVDISNELRIAALRLQQEFEDREVTVAIGEQVEIPCDYQPGNLRELYQIEWIRFLASGVLFTLRPETLDVQQPEIHLSINPDTYSLTVRALSSLQNGDEYQCRVRIRSVPEVTNEFFYFGARNKLNVLGFLTIEILAVVANEDESVDATIAVCGEILSGTLFITLTPRNVSGVIMNDVQNASALSEDLMLTVTIQALLQDKKYTMTLQSETGLNISRSQTLLTTGVQQITAEAGFGSATVTCHFLQGARADGCLVEWVELDGNDTATQGNSSVLIERQNASLTASGEIRNLLSNSSYLVKGFSTRRGILLHDFPIFLQSVLNTLDSLPEPEPTQPVSTTEVATRSMTEVITPSVTPTSTGTDFFASLVFLLVVAISAVTVLTVSVGILVVFICVRYRRAKELRNLIASELKDIEPQPNLAYEDIAFPLGQNAAYGVTGKNSELDNIPLEPNDAYEPNVIGRHSEKDNILLEPNDAYEPNVAGRHSEEDDIPLEPNDAYEPNVAGRHSEDDIPLEPNDAYEPNVVGRNSEEDDIPLEPNDAYEPNAAGRHSEEDNIPLEPNDAYEPNSEIEPYEQVSQNMSYGIAREYSETDYTPYESSNQREGTEVDDVVLNSNDVYEVLEEDYAYVL